MYKVLKVNYVRIYVCLEDELIKYMTSKKENVTGGDNIKE